MLRSQSSLLVFLVLAVCSASQAATVRVQGNMTSRVLANPSGGLPSEDIIQHPGDTGPVPASPAGAQLFQDLSASVVGAGANLHLSGHAQLGSLSIFGSADAFFSPPQGQSASASGGIEADWFARMTLLGGAGLPNGSVVEVLATVVIHGDGSLSGNAENFLQASFGFGGLAPGISLRCFDFTSSCDLTQSFVLRGIVGSTYSLSSIFSLGVSAAAARLPVMITSSQATVTASNTSVLYLDVLTPGGSYVLDDGSVLPGAPVPEPSVVQLVLVGSAALAMARSRRWR